MLEQFVLKAITTLKRLNLLIYRGKAKRRAPYAQGNLYFAFVRQAKQTSLITLILKRTAMTKLSVKMRSHSSLRPATVLKKKLRQRCFLVNFAKFLRTPFLIEHFGCCFCQSSWEYLEPILFFAWYLVCEKNRSSHPDVLCKKGVLRNFKKFTGKHLCQSLFLNKVAGLRQVFSW